MAAGSALFAVVGYMAASSSMLLINKAAVMYLPHSSHIILLQMLASVVILLAGLGLGITKFDLWSNTKARQWVGVVFCWLAPMVLNMKALQFLNLETVIVFRTLSVVFVAAGDVYFLGQSFSSSKLCGMALICVGGLIYASTDLNFHMTGYLWAAGYLFATVFNTVYIKQVFNELPQMGDWEKTYYNNLMGMPIQTFMAVSTENTGNFVSDVMLLNSTGLAIVLGSCVMGFGISLFGTICRNAVSATAFNILGNLNKFATIAFSAVFLGSRNSPTAISGLILSLVGGAVYSLGDVLGAPSKKAE